MGLLTTTTIKNINRSFAWCVSSFVRYTPRTHLSFYYTLPTRAHLLHLPSNRNRKYIGVPSVFCCQSVGTFSTIRSLSHMFNEFENLQQMTVHNDNTNNSLLSFFHIRINLFLQSEQNFIHATLRYITRIISNHFNTSTFNSISLYEHSNALNNP